MRISATAMAESQYRVAVFRFFQYRYAATIITKGNMIAELPMKVSVFATLTQMPTSVSIAKVNT